MEETDWLSSGGRRLGEWWRKETGRMVEEGDWVSCGGRRLGDGGGRRLGK